MVGWLDGCLVGFSVECLDDCLVVRLSCWMAVGFFGWSLGWLDAL